jgi:Family of unknown function (DUF6416)
MSPWTRSDMVELTFEIPDRLVGEFYIAVGAVLKRAFEPDASEQEEPEEQELHDWGTESFDSELVDLAWRKFSPRAQAVFSMLMENPGVAMTSDDIAAKAGLARGRHSLAGVVAWPSRQCADLGLTAPFRVEAPGGPGDTAYYWMDPETARLFLGARERFLAKQAEVRPQDGTSP